MQISEATQILKNNDFRLTQSRLSVLRELIKAESPLNAYEISGLSNINVVTVYRVLEVLEKLKIVHFLKSLKKYVICENRCQVHCHHQFVCSKCKKVTDLHLEDSSWLDQAAENNPGLKIENHYFEFSGFCEKCNII